jgi:hypothetical protein
LTGIANFRLPIADFLTIHSRRLLFANHSANRPLEIGNRQLLSLARRLNIDVDLLRSASSEYLSSEHIQPYQYHDDEDCEYRNNSNATATASFTFFGHEVVPPDSKLLRGG